MPSTNTINSIKNLNLYKSFKRPGCGPGLVEASHFLSQTIRAKNQKHKRFVAAF